MGYRSEVVIAIKNSIIVEGKILIALDENFRIKNVIDNATYWYHKYIKWYDDFDEVKIISEF